MRVSRKAPDSLTQNRKEAFSLPMADWRVAIALSIGEWGLAIRLMIGDWRL
jgi:hypothetical protein